MIFSPTEIGSWQRCHRKAWLTSKNGRHLTKIFNPLALNVGTLMHRAGQLWLEQPETSLHNHALTAANEMLAEVAARYQRVVGGTPSASELATTYESIELALSMAQNYQQRYGQPLPPEYKLVSAEQIMRVPIPGTEHHLEGRVDALLLHIPTGRYDILERKTYANRPKEYDLRFNQQFQAYRYMVKILTGFPPELLPVICYDGLWRRTQPPRGRTFEDLFARYQLRTTPQEIADFEAMLIPIANGMAQTYDNPAVHAYPVRPWNGCWDCQITELCDSITRHEDYELLIQANYSERTDDFVPAEEDAQ